VPGAVDVEAVVQRGDDTKDVVCRMKVNDKKFVSTYKGKPYYFCSSNCKSMFEKNPEKFVK